MLGKRCTRRKTLFKASLTSCDTSMACCQRGWDIRTTNRPMCDASSSPPKANRTGVERGFVCYLVFIVARRVAVVIPDLHNGWRKDPSWCSRHHRHMDLRPSTTVLRLRYRAEMTHFESDCCCSLQRGHKMAVRHFLHHSDQKRGCSYHCLHPEVVRAVGPENRELACSGPGLSDDYRLSD